MSDESRHLSGSREPYTPHPPGFILPPERDVDCGCDVRLQRPVLRDPSGWNNRITR
jgi:hypothetical protein